MTRASVSTCPHARYGAARVIDAARFASASSSQRAVNRSAYAGLLPPRYDGRIPSQSKTCLVSLSRW